MSSGTERNGEDEALNPAEPRNAFILSLNKSGRKKRIKAQAKIDHKKTIMEMFNEAKSDQGEDDYQKIKGITVGTIGASADRSERSK